MNDTDPAKSSDSADVIIIQKSKLRDYLETLAVIFFLPSILLLTLLTLLYLSHTEVIDLYPKRFSWTLIIVALIAGLATWICHIVDANAKDEIMFAFAGLIGLAGGITALITGTAAYWWICLGAVPFLLIGIFFRVTQNQLGAKQETT